MGCPGSATVSVNERADDITSGLQLSRAEVLRGLRNVPNMERQKHYSIDRLKEIGVDRGSCLQYIF